MKMWRCYVTINWRSVQSRVLLSAHEQHLIILLGRPIAELSQQYTRLLDLSDLHRLNYDVSVGTHEVLCALMMCLMYDFISRFISVNFKN